MIDHHSNTEIILLFRSLEDVQRDQEEIMSAYREECAKAHRLLAEAEADIAKMDLGSAEIVPRLDYEALDKITRRRSTVEAELFKAHCVAKFDEIRASIKARSAVVSAQNSAMREYLDRMSAAIKKRDDRLHGVGEVARRTMRFASAQRRHYGAGATILSIGKKQ